MRPLFARNLSHTGQRVRGRRAVYSFLGAGSGHFVSGWLGAGVAVGGVLALCGALLGWYARRACGIKTCIRAFLP
jgi:hypothetical protein